MNVFLLDGYNLLYRAFASLPQTIVGRDGLPINAIYGALSAVIRLLRDPGADHAVLAMDTPAIPTFRHALLPEYQGQRGPLGGDHAEEFARQVTVATTLFAMLGIPVVAFPGFEADDVMGSLAVALAQSDAAARTGALGAAFPGCGDHTNRSSTSRRHRRPSGSRHPRG